MENTTRIADLPENTITPSFLESKETKIQPPSYPAMNYEPLDIHPSPYGFPKPTGDIDFSRPPPPPTPLPSRDYPSNPGVFVHDEQIQPHYIPKPRVTADYIMNHPDDDAAEWMRHKQNQHRLSKMDRFMDEIQTPLIVALLFFLFHTQQFRQLFFYYFSAFPVFDGETPNNTGMIIKSLLFGAAFYAALRLRDYMSE
jgi:hypothetical protein